MASGRPVIAFGSGGALETVVPGLSGMLFNEQTPEAIIDAVESFEAQAAMFDPQAIRAHAARFSTRNFKLGMELIIQEELRARKTAALQPAPTAKPAASLRHGLPGTGPGDRPGALGPHIPILTPYDHRTESVTPGAEQQIGCTVSPRKPS